MKKKKPAFTLAEIAVAMAVVGIVAAIVTPMAVKTIQKKQTEMNFAKTVKQIELGCQREKMVQLSQR